MILCKFVAKNELATVQNLSKYNVYALIRYIFKFHIIHDLFLVTSKQFP